MNAKKFSDAMSELDNKYVDEALNYKRKAKKSVWVKWGTIAACVCLIAVVGIMIPFGEHQDAVTAPMITIMDKNYVAPNMPVEELPEEYHYLRDLTEKEANDTGLAGCAIYVNPQDEDMSKIYLYQECGTPIDEQTVDNTQRQWAYVQWIVLE